MTDPSGIITTARQKFITTRSLALAHDTERYLLHPGGTIVLSLDAGESIDLQLKHGLQSVELIALGADGSDALAALGLSASIQPLGIHRALSRESEDAQRVRAGLARRGLADRRYARCADFWARRARWKPRKPDSLTAP